MTIKDLYAKYKKFIFPAVLGLALVLGSSWLFRACDLKDGYSVLAGEYKAQLAVKKIDEKAKLREIAALTKDVTAKDKQIVGLESEVAKKQASIASLSATQSALRGELAGAKTDAERVPILTGMVTNLEQQLSLSMSVISDKDKEIGLLKTQVGDYKKISENYKALWEGAVQREETLSDMNDKLSGQLRVARLGGKVKTGLVLAAVAYLVIDGVKK